MTRITQDVYDKKEKELRQKQRDIGLQLSNWHIFLIAIISIIALLTIVLGADNVIDVMSELIVNW